MRTFPILVLAALLVAGLFYGASSKPADLTEVPQRPTAEPGPPLLAPRPSPGPEPEPRDDPILGSPEIEEYSEEGAPQLLPDPVREGPCRLVLRLTSEESGEPLSGFVELWRIDAPANPGWTRGDQRQATQELASGLATFERLPVSRYRVYAHRQRRFSEDPAAFEVSGEETEVRLEVPVPQKRRVYVRVVDERGDVIESAIRYDRGRSHVDNQSAPDWVTHREPTTGAGTIGIGGGAGGSFRGYKQRVTGDIRGFDWGLVLDDIRRVYKSTRHELLVEGRSTTLVQVGGHAPRGRTYLGVAVPLDLVYDRVTLPDGQRAVDQGARIRVTSRAVLQTPATSPDVHRTLPIEVSVEAEEYKPLSFKFTLDDLEWLKTLQPKP